MSIPRWIRRLEPTLVPIGPAVWQLLQTFACLTPLKPPSVPLVSRRAFFWRISILRRIRRRVPNLVPIGPAVWQLPRLLNLWPPKTPQNAPWDIERWILFSLCPFPDESADVYQIRCQSVQPFDSFPRLFNVWPLKPPNCPPMALQMCAKFFANRSRLLNLWHPNSSPPLEIPPGYWGATCI